MAEETHPPPQADKPIPWAAVFAIAAGFLAVLNLYQGLAGPAITRAAESAQLHAEIAQLKDAALEDRRRFALDIEGLRRDLNAAQAMVQKLQVDMADLRGDVRAMGRK